MSGRALMYGAYCRSPAREKKWDLGSPVDDDKYWFMPEEMDYESEPTISWQVVNYFPMRS